MGRRGSMMGRYSAAAVAVLFATAGALVSQSLASKKSEMAQRLLATSSGGDLPDQVLVFSGVTTSDAADELPPGFEEDIIEALEADDQVTVVGDVQFVELVCQSLEATEDADIVQIAISPSETILAQKTSFTHLSGDIFEDGMSRQVWVGEEVVDDVVDPRRTVTITWGEVCNVETFLLKVTSSDAGNGVLSVTKSIPCVPGASVDLCFVETEVTPFEEDEPESASTDTEGRVRSRALVGQTARPLPAAGKVVTDAGRVSSGDRHLQSTTTIDVMYLYTQGGKDLLGGISDAQMQTTLATALTTSNDATTNSDIDLTFSLVYVGQLPYEETSTSSSTILENLSTDENVADLRDTHDADLVQMAGNVGFSCGIANLFSGSSADGFSAVNPLCIDSLTHTHEIGHNLGCFHNRDNSNAQTDFAHGYRYCDGTDPYRTIMSSFCSDPAVPRINWFSNPDVVALNRSTGTNDNDCARAIEENMSTVADFRPLNPCLDENDLNYKCNGLRNGRVLDLQRCGLTDVDAFLLRSCFEVVNIGNIRTIKLQRNSLTTLPNDLFDGMDRLDSVNLQRNCGLTCVPPLPLGSVLLSGCNSGVGTCAV